MVEEANNPLAVSINQQEIDNDDILSGAHDIDSAQLKQQQLTSLMASVQFQL